MSDTRSEIIELKDCPFCGGRPRVSENPNHYGRVYCECINDDGTVGKETWNMRAI